MPLRVHSFMQYLTAKVDTMRPADYASLMVVKAVKGKPVGGRPTALKYNEKRYDFSHEKPGPAVDLWIAWAIDTLKANAPTKGQFLLVPVPNKVAVLGTTADFPTFKLSARLAAAFGERAQVAAELWWSEQLKPAKEGGPRFAEQLYPYLRLRASQSRAPRILIDDVLTSGGHLKACAAKLREIEVDPICAICCGRTSNEQMDNPYDVPIEQLGDFDPHDPRGIKHLFGGVED